MNTNILLFLVFAFSIFFTLRPFKYKKYTLDMASAPVVGFIVLLLAGIINKEIITEAFLGNDLFQPWKVIVVFFTVAYSSISVDVTGFFDFLAYKILTFAKGNGRLLFFLIYMFASVLTVFTSNDIVILTLTPIIYYVGKHSKMNVVHLLFAEFFAANTWSMMFYIGNPTNIILASAAQIGFFEYVSVMFFPTLIAGFITLVLLILIFQKHIDQEYSVNILPASFGIRNRYDVIISVFLLLAMLVTLAISELFLPFEIWEITTFFCILFIFEDLIFSLYYWLKKWHLTEFEQEKSIILARLQGIPEEINEFVLALKRVPWKILPFVLCFFVFIKVVDSVGFIYIFTEYAHSMFSSDFMSTFGFGIVGVLIANIINNQPMSIFFSEVMFNYELLVDSTRYMLATYSLIIASNLGANLTILGALAGLMWQEILSAKGIKINYIDFLKVGILICPIVLFFTLLTLYYIII